MAKPILTGIAKAKSVGGKALAKGFGQPFVDPDNPTNPQQNVYGGGGTTGIQAQGFRNDIKLQGTKKPGPSSDIVNENLNTGFGKGTTLGIRRTSNGYMRKMK